MTEIVALLLIVVAAALTWLVVQQRARLKEAEVLLSHVRATLNQKSSALSELESSIKSRDAAIKDLQGALTIANSEGAPADRAYSEVLGDLSARAGDRGRARKASASRATDHQPEHHRDLIDPAT